MPNLQSSLNKILGTALVARQLQLRDPRRKEKQELKEAENNAAKSERTIAAYEKYIRGNSISPEQSKLVQKAVSDEQKTHAANTEKLVRADPSRENTERYLSQGTSKYMQDRMRALSRMDEQQKMVSSQRSELAARIKKMQDMPTSLGGTLGDLPEELQKKIMRELQKGNNHGEK